MHFARVCAERITSRGAPVDYGFPPRKTVEPEIAGQQAVDRQRFLNAN
jgi:hypothetical protein